MNEWSLEAWNLGVHCLLVWLTWLNILYVPRSVAG